MTRKYFVKTNISSGHGTRIKCPNSCLQIIKKNGRWVESKVHTMVQDCKDIKNNERGFVCLICRKELWLP